MADNKKIVDELQVRGKNYDIADSNARERITDVQKFFAPVEASSTFSKNYTTGSYFIYENKLYKCLQNVTSGSTMNIGVNCQLSNVKAIIDIQYSNENLAFLQQ